MTDVLIHTEYIGGIPFVELPKYRRKPLVEGPTEVSDGLNVELLDEIMNFIKEHPSSWRQTSWYRAVDTRTGEEIYYSNDEVVGDVNHCNTSFCFAGHVALAEGFPYPPMNNEEEWEREVSLEEGHYEFVSDFARKRLGLTPEQADVLFSGENSMTDLENIVDLLKASNGKAPEYHLLNVRYRTREDAKMYIDDLKDYWLDSSPF